MLRIFHTHPAKTSLLQDFAFYEVRLHDNLHARNNFCYIATIFAENTGAGRYTLFTLANQLVHPFSPNPSGDSSVFTAAAERLWLDQFSESHGISDPTNESNVANATRHGHGHGPRYGITICLTDGAGHAPKCHEAS